MTNKPSVALDYTAQFKKELKRFYRKYPHIQADIQPLIDDLQQGKIQGDQVPGVGYTVYKVRVRSTDQTKGKSGGYRVIYYLRTAQFVVLLRIYHKSVRSDLPPDVIRQVIQEYERNSN